MNCLECVKLQKRLRVQLSDHEFELRKLSEDNSTQKALYEIAMQKELRRYQDRYHKEKQDHEENARKWLAKIDSVNEANAGRIRDVESNAQNTIAAHKQRFEAELVLYKQTTDAALGNAIAQMRQQHQMEVREKDTAHAGELERIRTRHAEQIEQMQAQHVQQHNKLRNDYESNILGLRAESNAEQKNHSQQQEDAQRERNRLNAQIVQLNAQNNHLQAQIAQLTQALTVAQQHAEAQEQQIQQMQADHISSLAAAEKKYSEGLQELQERMERRMRELYEKELRVTEEYERTVLKMEENREIELRLYDHKMNEIKNCVESRPSRLEDLEEILTLKDKLSRKEREFETLQREVKHYQLQLENKEDTYNKIFIPTINSTHLNSESGVIKRKELKVKRPAGKSVSTVREILNSVNLNANNLPLLNNLDKKCLPPRSTKIL